MKKMMVFAAALLAAMFVFSQDGEIVKVRGKGTGADKAEALKDAYRDAVERAVGLYVDAEQMMKNEELVKDQILTQSNAYIEKYDVAKETTKPNGLVEIQILAEVRRAALTKKISDVVPTKTFRLNDGLKNEHAKMTTVEKRNVDGAALLKKALAGFDPLTLIADCSLASPVAVMRERRHPLEPKNTVAANYLFRTAIDQNRYFKSVVPRLLEALAQISLSEPRKITISVKPGDVVDVEKMVEKGKGSPNRLEYLHEEITSPWPKMSFDAPPTNPNAAALFILVVGGNKYRTVYNGMVYELDEASMKVLSAWRTKLCRNVEFNVSLLDDSGDLVYSGKVPSWGTGVYGCVTSRSVNVRVGKNMRGIEVTWMTPWNRGNCGHAEFVYYFWREFVIPKDALPDVKDMKIELVQ